MEPLAFAILAGCTPKDCQVELYDERLEEIPERMDADLVAITSKPSPLDELTN
jgi:hypothetical protein